MKGLGDMRARNRVTAATHRVVAAGALLVLLTGCSGGAEPSSSAAPTAMAQEVEDLAPLDCPAVVPAAGVAGILGVPVEDLAQVYPDPATAEASPNSEAVAIVMAAAAREASGEQSCGYWAAVGTEDESSVRVSVLPDSARYFALTEPDSNDGHPMLPVDLGDSAFFACRGGEWDGCRAQILVGESWLSVTVARQEPDETEFLAYAGTLVGAVAEVTLASPPIAARVECPALLSPFDLTESGHLVDAGGGDITPVGSGNFRFEVPAYLAGLVDCSWGSDQGAGRDRVHLTVLPAARNAWSHASIASLNSSIPVQPVDLSHEADARWPEAGIEALSGCSDDECQVTLLADDVWLTVTTTGPADLADATALAVRAFARYAAAV